MILKKEWSWRNHLPKFKILVFGGLVTKLGTTLSIPWTIAHVANGIISWNVPLFKTLHRFSFSFSVRVDRGALGWETAGCTGCKRTWFTDLTDQFLIHAIFPANANPPCHPTSEAQWEGGLFPLGELVTTVFSFVWRLEAARRQKALGQYFPHILGILSDLTKSKP